MSEFKTVASLDDLPMGASRCYEVDGRRIAVYHTNEGVFATDNTCPHRGGPLAEGDLQGVEITCPWHFWTFEVRTGRHADPRIRLVTHEVEVDGGRIRIRLAEPAGEGGRP